MRLRLGEDHKLDNLKLQSRYSMVTNNGTSDRYICVNNINRTYETTVQSMFPIS